MYLAWRWPTRLETTCFNKLQNLVVLAVIIYTVFIWSHKSSPTIKLKSWICVVLLAFILQFSYELYWQAVHKSAVCGCKQFVKYSESFHVGILIHSRLREGPRSSKHTYNLRVLLYEYIRTRFAGITGFLNPYCGTVNCGKWLSHGVRKCY